MMYEKRVVAVVAAIVLALDSAAYAQGSKTAPLITPSGSGGKPGTAPVRETGSPGAPIELAPKNIARTFHLLLNQRELIGDVLEIYGIQATIDQSVTGLTVSFDASDVDFPDAARLLQLATDTFLVPLGPHRVLVLHDSRENRAKYQRQLAETFQFSGLSNLELSDMENIARNVLGLEHAIIHPSQRTITVRGPETDLGVLTRVYDELLRGRSELLLDVHAYEVDRTKETDTGVILPNSATMFNLRSAANSILANNAALVQEIVQSGEAAAGDWQKIIAILIASDALSGTVFNSPFVVFGGGLTETGAEWNTSAANMLLNSSDVKLLNQGQLRVLDREEGTFRVGERYPIMTSAYSIGGLAPGSSSHTTPQIQYVDLGLTLKVRPYIGDPAEAILHFEIELSSLAGVRLNGIPVLTNRQYSSVVSLQPGNSALLVSALSKQDSRELTGAPGLSDVSGFGDATNPRHTTEDTELVILVTPHVIRAAHTESSGPMLPLSRGQN